MRLTGQLGRVAAVTPAADLRTPRSRPSLSSALTGLALLAVLSACRDSLTSPEGLRPPPPSLTLTGGVGTPIFPNAPVGEFQGNGVAIGLNNAGQVTGSGRTSYRDDDFTAFRWSLTTGAQSIGCCVQRWGNDINDAGTVVGVAQTDLITGNRGFVAAGASPTALSILPGADPESSGGALAINNAGQVVGLSPTSARTTHAVLWSATGVIQDLGTLGGTNSVAIDINDAGQVIGVSQVAGDAAAHFFLWSSATGMQDLSTIIDTSITNVVAINAAGQIIGSHIVGGASHAFLYTPNTGLHDLGTLGGTRSAPTGLNDNGDVVGSSTLSDRSTHAFLWTAAEGMEDITALSGVPEVQRLNNKLQTITGTLPPSYAPTFAPLGPRLVQLQVTQSNAPPTAVFVAECNGLTCALDASGSLDDKPGLTYVWSLDKYPGGSASGAKVTVNYPHAGQRTVVLTVTDAQGLQSTISRTLTITEFPVASFTASCVGLTCTFDASASTSDVLPIELGWRFGDGQTGFNVVAPSHTFAQPGLYSVTLEVLDASLPGRRAVLTKVVTVGNFAATPPRASFTFSCSGQSQEHQCAFDASGSTDDVGIVSYRWEWGNGRNETKQTPIARNTWAAPGTYTVTLRVTDTDGLIAVTRQQVMVP